MKNPKNTLMLILSFSIIVLLFTFGDFLALHDIKSDYISPSILDELNIDLAEKLPDWTAAKLEWGLATISLYFKLLLMIFNVVAMIMVFKKLYITDKA